MSEGRTWPLLALGLVVAAFTMIGIPAHATYGARVTADEPQYLLTALSLGTDGDLDIGDELAAEAYRPFHEVDLDQQTSVIDEAGRQVSPHDPLLPLVLAAPMRIGGWAAAKGLLAVCAGALAALTAWTAIRRFGVRPRTAIVVVAAFGCTAPLATYATQVYPEVPAALAVVAAVAAATGGDRRRHLIVMVLALTALPWLSVKYTPIAAAILLPALWRWRRHPRAVATLVGGIAAMAVAYLLAHQYLYGGWTAYATGDHFAETGEFAVIGHAPNYLGRARRLAGLLVDDGFGLAAWMPAWLLVPVAVGWLARRRPSGTTALLAPLAAGWLVATFVALTMHGWWWPGRQVVVVLPLAVIAVAAAVDSLARLRAPFVALTLLGMGTWLWTTVEAIIRRRVLVVDFDQTANPWYRLWRLALPDGRSSAVADELLAAAWALALVAFVVAGWRRGRAVTAGLTAARPRARLVSASLPP